MDLHLQYSFVKSSREVLLDYCQQIPVGDFIKEGSAFGRGSIRNLLVHIGNTYEFWIGKQALGRNINFRSYEAVTSITEVRNYFIEIDTLVSNFIDLYSERCLEDLILDLDGRIVIASPFKLFSHVITHEFHHKGQVLSLSRQLGYIPVDTDIIR